MSAMFANEPGSTNETSTPAKRDVEHAKSAASGFMPLAWRVESNGESAIRIQLLDSSFAEPSLPQTFNVSAGLGYRCDPFVTRDSGTTGWGVAWLESAGQHAPARVKFTVVGALGGTGAELTVHDESKGASGHGVHQHDVVLGSGMAIDPGAPADLLAGRMNVVWVSTDLDPANDITTATPYGRIMLRRYDLSAAERDDPAMPRVAVENGSAENGALPVTINNAPVQIGFGRDPSITVLDDKENAITWIDQHGQLQGVLISDEVHSADASGKGSLITRIRDLAAGPREQSKSNAKSGWAPLIQLLDSIFYGELQAFSAESEIFAPPSIGASTAPPAGSLAERNVHAAGGDGPAMTAGAQSDANDMTQVGQDVEQDVGQTENPIGPLELDTSSIGKLDAVPPVTHESSSSADIPYVRSARGTGGALPTLDHAHHEARSPSRNDTSASPPPNVDAVTPHALTVAPDSTVALVRVVTAADGHTIVVGPSLNSPDDPSAGPVQLSDDQGVVANPTMNVGELGYLAVWEEKAEASDATGDLKGSYWSFGDAVNGIAPGRVGQEFAIHSGTPNIDEHDPVITNYRVIDGNHQTIEFGFNVVYVATELAAHSPDFGAVKVARFAIPLDQTTGEQQPPVAIRLGGTPADPVDGDRSGADADDIADSDDILITTVAASGRDPSAALLQDGEYIVTWVGETGHVQGKMFVPNVAGLADGGHVTSFDPMALDLSDISGSAMVAQNQVEKVASLGDDSFVVVWVTDHDNGNLDLVGRLFTASGPGQWAPSDVEIFVKDVNLSQHDERVDFTISLAEENRAEFVIAYHIGGDIAGEYHSGPFDSGVTVDVIPDASAVPEIAQFAVSMVADNDAMIDYSMLLSKPEPAVDLGGDVSNTNDGIAQVLGFDHQPVADVDALNAGALVSAVAIIVTPVDLDKHDPGHPWLL
jgi:hypothetical protein